MGYAISTNEEDFSGDFATEEAAIAEALAMYDEDQRFYVGKTRPPRQPETFIDVDDLFYGMGDGDDDWSLECAGWDKPTKEQAAELQDQFKAVMSAWLDKYMLRPRWFVVDDVNEYVIQDDQAVCLIQRSRY